MKCFVTGGSGFVGANVIHELNSRGIDVRALLRNGADLRGLEGARFDRVEGDLINPAALARGMEGCDWCFHIAASYHLWLRDYAPMYAANVAGTDNVIAAAVKAGVKRIVYTSTVGCIAPPRTVAGQVRPSDETCVATAAQMSNHYKLSKFQAEEVAFRWVSKGAPVIIVNPTAPIGPRDVKPTPTGQIIVDFLNRAMPAFLDTGLNWVHVRDVAVGHVLAAERGRVGERYILGNANGNWTLQEALLALERLTGLPAPRWQAPYTLAMAAAYASEGWAKVSGRPPKAPLAGVRMAKYKMFFDPRKAVDELGLPQTPAEEALRDAIDWFKSHGYVRNVSVRSPEK